MIDMVDKLMNESALKKKKKEKNTSLFLKELWQKILYNFLMYLKNIT